ncbi:hypothetical protein FOL46_002062 [Perkinsus olseni]|uniref:Uncharacterized protein n=1 Tax=Perkinsus olseni TaxID=32597 RepID=A0A7J6KPF8_PEROL|nr:hypothetical protein FOL46_002062 [Perkinsus olseni]
MRLQKPMSHHSPPAATLRSSDQIDRTELDTKICRFIGQMGSRHLATIVWSMASAQNWPADPENFSRILRSLSDIPRPLHHQELADTLWALARAPEKFRTETREVASALMARYVKRADTKFRFADQHSANILWAIAKLGIDLEVAKGVLSICVASINESSVTKLVKNIVRTLYPSVGGPKQHWLFTRRRLIVSFRGLC